MIRVGRFGVGGSDPSRFAYTAIPSSSSDSRVIYVSSSAGDNSNDGLSDSAPKETWWGTGGANELMRAGYPDRMLLKCGDSWSPLVNTHYIGLAGGRSADEPMILSSYGVGARPRIENTQIRIGYNVIGMLGHVYVVGIHMQRTFETVEPGDPDNYSYPVGIQVVTYPSTTTNFLIEDCFVEKYAINIGVSTDDFDTKRVTDVRVRGCVIVDAYATGGVHAQGMYMESADDILVEGNVLDHNGWNADILGAGQTQFNHNIYVNNNCTQTTFRNNLTARASSFGMPAGFACVMNDRNLFVANANGCNVNHVQALQVVRGNFFYDGADIHGPNMDDAPGDFQGGGTAIGVGGAVGSQYDDNVTEIYDNVASNQVSGTQPFGVQFGAASRHLSIRNNLFYRWGLAFYLYDGASFVVENELKDNVVCNPTGGAGGDSGKQYLLFSNVLTDFSGLPMSGNQWFADTGLPAWDIVGNAVTGGNIVDYADFVTATGETGGSYAEPSFPDPERSPARYSDEVLGGAATQDAFLAWARGLSKDGGRHPDSVTRDPINWLRAGFGLAAV